MFTTNHFSSGFQNRRVITVILASVSLSGLLFGIVAANNAGSLFSDLVRTASACCVSTVGLVFGALLPFLIAAVAVQLSAPCLLFLVCFFKSISYGFLLKGTLIAFPSSGWMVCFMLLFTDHIVVMLYHLAVLRVMSPEGDKRFHEILLCAVGSLAAALIDIVLISPLLADVIYSSGKVA